jgi:hypothetical protein
MLFPFFGECFSRPILQQWIAQARLSYRLYWCVFTPLLTLWCLVIQRLKKDHTLDAVVSHVHTGAADYLDPHADPVSARLTSESTSAFSQGRKRLPLALVQWATHRVRRVLTSSLPVSQQTWKGHRVRLLDGTTFGVLGTDDLDRVYGRSQNQHGLASWITVRSVAAFCLFSRMLVGIIEGSERTSEQAMVRSVLEQDDPGAIYVGDANFGVYRVVQVATAVGHELIVRLQATRFHALLRTVKSSVPITSGQTWNVTWTPSGKIDPTLSAQPIAGRIMFVRLEKKGFRSKDLYLFTTLQDEMSYPVDEIVALYGERWQVEINYRHIKTTLEMDTFAVQSVAMFRLELAAGSLTYNLICGLLLRAAQRANLCPHQLSFARCWRRIRDALIEGVPDWVWQKSDPHTHLLDRLARCRHQNQPWKVAHEPRKVRYRNRTYPPLRGDRNAARQAALDNLGIADTPLTDEVAGSDPPLDQIAGTPAPPGETAQQHQRLDAS